MAHLPPHHACSGQQVYSEGNSKSFKSYFGKDAVYNFIKCMVEKSKYCTDVVEKHFNKKLELTKKDDEYFNNSAKCWIYNDVYAKSDVKVKGHCHIIGKYRGLAQRSRL